MKVKCSRCDQLNPHQPVALTIIGDKVPAAHPDKSVSEQHLSLLNYGRTQLRPVRKISCQASSASGYES